jgi:hypothetical protein
MIQQFELRPDVARGEAVLPQPCLGLAFVTVPRPAIKAAAPAG